MVGGLIGKFSLTHPPTYSPLTNTFVCHTFLSSGVANIYFARACWNVKVNGCKEPKHKVLGFASYSPHSRLNERRHFLRVDRFWSELFVVLLLLLLFHLTSQPPGRVTTMRFLPKQWLCHRPECTSAKSLRCLKVFARLHSRTATFHFHRGVQGKSHTLCPNLSFWFLCAFYDIN